MEFFHAVWWGGYGLIFTLKLGPNVTKKILDSDHTPT